MGRVKSKTIIKDKTKTQPDSCGVGYDRGLGLKTKFAYQTVPLILIRLGAGNKVAWISKR